MIPKWMMSDSEKMKEDISRLQDAVGEKVRRYSQPWLTLTSRTDGSIESRLYALGEAYDKLNEENQKLRRGLKALEWRVRKVEDTK